MSSWKTVTLGDVSTGLSRYRPLILVAAAILVAAVVLPGQTGPDNQVATTADIANEGFANSADGTSSTLGGADSPTVGGAPADGFAVGAGGATGGIGGARSGSGATAGARASGPVAPASGGGNVPLVANCDAKTGRIAVPSKFAPPCVAAHAGSNGGATYPGVTADKIKVVLYRPQADPATTAALTAAGAANSLEDTLATFKDYISYFEAHYNLYGRTIALEIKEGSGKSDDDAAAQADAIDIAKRIRPFAVTTAGGGTTLNSFSQTLAANKIICICGVSQPAEFYADRSPYLGYTTLMSSTQGYVHRAEYLCKKLKQEPAKHAGFRNTPADPMSDEARVYGLLYFETNDKAYKGGIDFFEQQLARCGIKLKNRIEFIYPLTAVQERAAAQISRLKSDGVTSVIFAGDPLSPAIFTTEATNQRWFPEWILTGSALTDTTLFARTYDQEQWRRAFGVSYLPARFPQEQADAYKLHMWHHGRPPTADNSYGVIYSTPFALFTGIHLAGPNLTPQAFQSGWLRYPPTGRGSLTAQGLAIGAKDVWRDIPDLTLYDDVTEIWWDPTATGIDEVGNPGKGMYRFVEGGKRYLPGEHPASAPRVFDPSSGVTFYDERPAQDRSPEYPRPKP